jgi:hydroxyacyl-ACP dehydratase HTD2-like protein with hotdog domain
MTDPDVLFAAADSPGAWKDAVEDVPVVANRPAMEVLAGCLDAAPPEDEVPPMWLTATAAWPSAMTLGEDGHPVTGLGYPPLEQRRRLFAGGIFRSLSPVSVGEPLTRRSRVSGVQAKAGRNGALLFVTVAHDYLDASGATRCQEEHQLAYRSARDAGVPVPVDAPAVESSETGPYPSLSLGTDRVRLFRFSAITANSHRIHYDESYATGVEGHPGVLVHGPLLAMLALELPRRYAAGRRVTSYAYRLRRPAVSGSDLVATVVEKQPDHWSVDVRASGVVTLTGEIHLDMDES